MKLRGKKRDARLVSGKTTHNVLLFGKKLVGSWDAKNFGHPNAIIDAIPFPQDYDNLGRLSEYTLVILD
jgi:hypothetical protein